MKSKKILSVFLSVLMIVLTISPITAFAQSSTGSSSNNTSVGEDLVQNKKTQYSEVEESNAKTEVALTVEDSDLIVSVPTTIIVSGTPNENGEYIGNYSIGVSGDMSGNKEVIIEPERSTIELLQKGKPNHNAAITQDKTLFYSDDFKNNATTTGIVTATGLTAGSWNGVTNFNIGIHTLIAEELKGYTTLYEYDLSATENDNVKAYYAVPNKNTQKIPVARNRSKKMKVAENYANVINYNGIQYTLSDEDTMVITGEGNMKPYISNDFYDYDAFYRDITNQFDDEYYITVYDSENNKQIEYNSQYESFDNKSHKKYKITFTKNSTQIRYVAYWSAGRYDSSRDFPQVKTTVNTYINSIKEKYATISPKSIVVSDGIKNIPAYSFAGMEYLENISFSDSLVSIEEYAFNSCKSIKNLDLKNVSKLGNYSFYDCTSLENVRVPYSVDYYNNRSFRNSDGTKTIKKITFYNTDGSYINYDCDVLTSSRLFWCGADEIIFENGITNIGTGMFYYDPVRLKDGIKKVTIPTTVTSIPVSFGSHDSYMLNNDCIINYLGTLEQFQAIKYSSGLYSNLYINGQPYQVSQ